MGIWLEVSLGGISLQKIELSSFKMDNDKLTCVPKDLKEPIVIPPIANMSVWVSWKNSEDLCSTQSCGFAGHQTFSHSGKTLVFKACHG